MKLSSSVEMDKEVQIIELVRENSCLYLKTDVNYNNNIYKDNLWAKIAATLNIDGKLLDLKCVAVNGIIN